jgi:hypothetical protein
MQQRKTLIVGGFFDDSGGKPSREIIPVLRVAIDYKATTVNGGYFSELERIVKNIKEYDVIYWFANVPNDKEKIVNEIKKVHEACILVTSKRNDNDKYDLSDIIYHALGIKSNLVVEFKKSGGKIVGRVLDPLANVFVDFTDDFEKIGKVLAKRVAELSGFTRVGSKRIGEKITAPDDDRFFEIVKNYATVFHDLIHHHPDATNRFFGNATFRCERGFPSVKDGDVIFVSRRNMDKRYVDKESFVAVNAGSSVPVQYHGDDKPSVDAPIQINLYQYYTKMKYMIHAHVYIDGAPTTDHVIPCGAVEEADDIINAFPNKNARKIYVNIRGHGSLVMASNIKDLERIPYVPMPVPLVNPGYLLERGNNKHGTRPDTDHDVLGALIVPLMILGIGAIPGFIIAAFIARGIGEFNAAPWLAFVAVGVVVAWSLVVMRESRAMEFSIIHLLATSIAAIVSIAITLAYPGSDVAFWFPVIVAIVGGASLIPIVVLVGAM